MCKSSLGRALTALFFGAALLQAGQAQYKQVNLVSDGFLPAVQKDPNLVNPWGMAWAPTGPIWVANNETSTSTVYNGMGQPFPLANPLIVSVIGDEAAPTGLVFNGGNGFPVSDGTNTAPSRFIFVTESGQIAGWNPNVAGGVASAVTVSGLAIAAETPIYKGAALANTATGPLLYATDFKNGVVNVFDGSFKFMGSFTDPNIPEDYGPFGIKSFGNFIVVTYAKADEDREDDVAGAGFGYVDVFTQHGDLVRRLISRGRLNAPWGMAIAPHAFGRFHDDLLVGNFGDGKINAYRLPSGRFEGTLSTTGNRPIEIEGLWEIAFGNGALGTSTRNLYFTAGPDDEEHGLFGYVKFNGNSS